MAPTFSSKSLLSMLPPVTAIPLYAAKLLS